MASSSYLINLVRIPEKWCIIKKALIKKNFVAANKEPSDPEETFTGPESFMAHSLIILQFMQRCDEEEADSIASLMTTSPGELDIDTRLLQTAFITQAPECLKYRETQQSIIRGWAKRGEGNKIGPLKLRLKRETPRWEYPWPYDHISNLFKHGDTALSSLTVKAALTYDPENKSHDHPFNGTQVWSVQGNQGRIHTSGVTYIQPYPNKPVLSMKLAIDKFLCSEDRPPGFLEAHGNLHKEFCLVGYNQEMVLRRLAQYNDYGVVRSNGTTKEMVRYLSLTAYSVYPNNKDVTCNIAFKNRRAIWYPLEGQGRSIESYDEAANLLRYGPNYPLRETIALLHGTLDSFSTTKDGALKGEGALMDVVRIAAGDRIVHAKVEVLPTECSTGENGEVVYTPKLPRTFATGLGCVRAAMGAILATYEEGFKPANEVLLTTRERRIRSIAGRQFTSGYLRECLGYMIGHQFTLTDAQRSRHMCPDRKRMEMTVTKRTRTALWGLLKASCTNSACRETIMELAALDLGEQKCKWTKSGPCAVLMNGALLSGHPFTSRLDDFDNQYHMVRALYNHLTDPDSGMYVSVGSDDGWIAWTSQDISHEEVVGNLKEHTKLHGAVWTELQPAVLATFRTSDFDDFINLRDVTTTCGRTFNAFSCHLPFSDGLERESQSIWVKIYGMVPCYFFDDNGTFQYAVPVYDMRKILVSSYLPHSEPRGLNPLIWKASRLSGINDVVGMFPPIHQTLKSGFDGLVGGQGNISLCSTDEHFENIPPMTHGLREPTQVLELWCDSHPYAVNSVKKKKDQEPITSWEHFDVLDDIDWATAFSEGEIAGGKRETYIEEQPLVVRGHAVPALRERDFEVTANFIHAKERLQEKLKDKANTHLLTCNPRKLAGELGISISRPELLQRMCALALGKSQVIKMPRDTENEEYTYSVHFSRGKRTFFAATSDQCVKRDHLYLWFLNPHLYGYCIIGLPDVLVEVTVVNGPEKDEAKSARRSRKKKKVMQGFKRGPEYEKPLVIKTSRKNRRMLSFQYGDCAWDEYTDEDIDEQEVAALSMAFADREADDLFARELDVRYTRDDDDYTWGRSMVSEGRRRR